MNVLSYNISFGSMYANELGVKYDTTSKRLAIECKKLRDANGNKHVCLKNVSDFLNASILNNKVNFIGTQESTNWDIIFNETSSLRIKFGCIKHTSINEDMASFFNNKDFIVIAIKIGDLKYGRPYQIIFSKYKSTPCIIINLHNPHLVSLNAKNYLQSKLSQNLNMAYLVENYKNSYNFIDISGNRVGNYYYNYADLGKSGVDIVETDISDLIKTEFMEPLVICMGDFNDSKRPIFKVNLDGSLVKYNNSVMEKIGTAWDNNNESVNVTIKGKKYTIKIDKKRREMFQHLSSDMTKRHKIVRDGYELRPDYWNKLSPFTNSKIDNLKTILVSGFWGVSGNKIPPKTCCIGNRVLRSEKGKDLYIGDYILVNNKMKIDDMFIPSDPIFYSIDNLTSDHLPITAKINVNKPAVGKKKTKKPVWQVNLASSFKNTPNWTNYNSKVSNHLETKFNGYVKFTYKGHKYLVDLQKMKQFREDSPKLRRKIRRIDNVQWQVNLSKHYKNTPKWTSYSEDETTKLESDYGNKLESNYISKSGKQYIINFDDLIQYEKSKDRTKFRRSVRRINNPIWQFNSGDFGGPVLWENYDKLLSEKIEIAYETLYSEFEYSLKGKKYLINIQDMMQYDKMINRKKAKRSIRRIMLGGRMSKKRYM